MQKEQATRWDVPGLMRRARRLGDLSQRELAVRLGVGRAIVGRWEKGKTIPDVEQLRRILAVASLDLVVVDAVGDPVEPMRDDAPRDRQRRRFPAHLDLGEGTDPLTGEPRFVTPYRVDRDRHRAAEGCAPADHPPMGFFLDERARARQARHERAKEAVRRRHLNHPPAPEPPPCSCPIACEEAILCTPTCTCQCEPATTSSSPARW